MCVLIEIPENYHRQNIQPNTFVKAFILPVCNAKKPKAAGRLQ